MHGRIRGLILVMAVLLAASSSARASQGPEGEGTPAATATDGAELIGVDGCTLLTSDEASRILGTGATLTSTQSDVANASRFGQVVSLGADPWIYECTWKGQRPKQAAPGRNATNDPDVCYWATQGPNRGMAPSSLYLGQLQVVPEALMDETYDQLTAADSSFEVANLPFSFDVAGAFPVQRSTFLWRPPVRGTLPCNAGRGAAGVIYFMSNSHHLAPGYRNIFKFSLEFADVEVNTTPNEMAIQILMALGTALSRVP